MIGIHFCVADSHLELNSFMLPKRPAVFVCYICYLRPLFAWLIAIDLFQTLRVQIWTSKSAKTTPRYQQWNHASCPTVASTLWPVPSVSVTLLINNLVQCCLLNPSVTLLLAWTQMRIRLQTSATVAETVLMTPIILIAVLHKLGSSRLFCHDAGIILLDNSYLDICQ